MSVVPLSRPVEPVVFSPFEQSLSEQARMAPGRLHAQAWERFQAVGLPTSKTEAWKYVDLRPLRQQAWGLPLQQSPLPDVFPLDQYCAFPVGESLRLVVVDGLFRPELSSDLSGVPLSLQVIDPQVDCQPDEADGWVALNQAFSPGGQLLWIPRGTRIEPVIEILQLTTAAAAGHWLAPRLHIELEPEAQAQVIVRWLGLPGAPSSLVNGHVTVRLEAHARLDLVERLAPADPSHLLVTLRAQQYAHSSFQHWSLMTQGATTRLAQRIELLGQQATCQLTGLALAYNHSALHNRVEVLHQAADCQSEQVFKALVNHQARSEFDGCIVVQETGTGTDARQLSNNVLLSPTAKAFARPWLQIDTDEVACSHGATVGQLSETELFYLLSRGIPLQQARAMLTMGVAHDALTRLPIESVRGFVKKQISCALASMVV